MKKKNNLKDYIFGWFFVFMYAMLVILFLQTIKTDVNDLVSYLSLKIQSDFFSYQFLVGTLISYILFFIMPYNIVENTCNAVNDRKLRFYYMPKRCF